MGVSRKILQKGALKYGKKYLGKKVGGTLGRGAARAIGLNIPGFGLVLTADFVSGLLGGPTIEGGIRRLTGHDEATMHRKQEQENSRAAAIMTDWSNAQDLRKGPSISDSTLAAMSMLEERFNPNTSAPEAAEGGHYGMAMANALARQSGNQVSAAQLYRAVRPEPPQDSRMLMYPSLWDGGDSNGQ